MIIKAKTRKTRKTPDKPNTHGFFKKVYTVFSSQLSEKTLLANYFKGKSFAYNKFLILCLMFYYNVSSWNASS